MKNKFISLVMLTLLVGISFISVGGVNAAFIDPPLDDRVHLTTYTYLPVSKDASGINYMLVGNKIYTCMGETIWADHGELLS